MPRRDARELLLADAEGRRDRLKIGVLGLVHGAVRLGDVEEAVEDVLEQLRLVREEIADLPRIGLEAVGRRLREFEQAGDAGVLALRHVDDFLEGVDLVRDDDAVGLRHLGGEGDEAGREDEVPRRRPEGRALAVDESVAGERAEERAHRAAEGEADAGAADLAPDRIAHAPW